MAESQAQLNEHFGPPTHGRMQQHTILSGLAGQVWLGDQLDSGWIKMHRGINMEKGFTEDGTGIWLNDVRWRRICRFCGTVRLANLDGIVDAGRRKSFGRADARGRSGVRDRLPAAGGLR